ncbi:[Fe-Fe] hydrogenase large subunit C-terminal domain-containing protein [Sporomusa termitida]|uniref:Electron transport complex subunit RsxB n=1 Tax=Sporomusa termitida TaxID=2377 RepID=A0A517DU47_9FIRM|nr:[Fe-Fe] hydrogenase large subunit C-terminal domain-containing protein [Sporomusa termitida]QDR80869.1 Electron transport complex subunit RsxB [Sporomusa termitida]
MTYLWKKCWEGNLINTILTHKVNCRDCFRCVRSCPVKAIAINKGHARVIEERCILCGRCVRECPQQAKQVDNQLQPMLAAISQGKRVVVSLAPSYIAAFPGHTLSGLAECLLQAGVTAVAETAEAADKISELYGTYLQNIKPGDNTLITSCCPVVVNIIEQYYPLLVTNLAPVISPMLAHAKMIRNQYGPDTFVVFAGPCIAKMAEGCEGSQADAVITFEQLEAWLQGLPAYIHKAVSPATPLLPPGTPGPGRYFPVSGGILRPWVAPADCDDIIAIDGLENCLEVFAALSKSEFTPTFIEAMACTGGCVGGPAMGGGQLLPVKRNKIITYAKMAMDTACPYPAATGTIDLRRQYQSRPVNAVTPAEDEIRDILKQTGKFSAKDEKNCGACGYDSCRAKAVAVFQGLAELEMCVPYMRSKAESFANIIVENSLNAIIAVNEKMIIKEFNPAVKRMFGAGKEIFKGMSLTELFDCSDFIATAQFGHKIVGKRVEYSQYGIITEQMIIPVPEHGLVIAIITDVTAHEQKSRELQQMKLETVSKATEIINKQMQVAQEIAGLLGETTAETKSALLEMIMLIKSKGDM